MIRADHFEIVPRLQELELDYEKLIEVIRYADAERAQCNAADPRGFDLITMNARAARGLRQQFCGERWEFDETDNQAGIRNPHIKVRVIQCNFDRNAGNRLADPTNLTEKGAASRAKVSCNQTAWIPGLPIPEEGDGGEYTTVVLGTFYDKDAQVVRAELSQPKNFSSGRYTRFAERIILLNGLEGDPVSGSRPEREGPTEIVDIPVARK